MHLLSMWTSTEHVGMTEISVYIQTIRQWGFNIGILNVTVVQISGNDHGWLRGEKIEEIQFFAYYCLPKIKKEITYYSYMLIYGVILQSFSGHTQTWIPIC